MKKLTTRSRAHLLLLLTTSIPINALLLGAAPPSITSPPSDQTVLVYQRTAFRVTASGTAPLAYQWLKDGVPISSATNDQFALPHARFGDGGRYLVLVSNAEAKVMSSEAMLTVNPPRAG